METKIEKLTTEKVFEPFQLCINVESLDELKMLWCRFNIIDDDIKKYNEDYCEKNNFTLNRESYLLWEKLDVYTKEYL